MPANELRGEVDIELDGQNYVLRPSYEAMVEAERVTGKALIMLATMAGDGALTLVDTALIVTAFIKAWGKANGDTQVQAFKAERIGELIHEYGLMAVQLRLSIVLGRAATGGYRADGKPRIEDDDDEGEAKAAGKTPGTPVASSPGSPALPSGGARGTSGKQRRTSSGRRSKSGKK